VLARGLVCSFRRKTQNTLQRIEETKSTLDAECIHMFFLLRGLQVYCFTHGLPTTKTGSWMPEAAAPLCGNATCLELQEKIWPELFKEKRTPWAIRKEMECQICRDERVRRCIVIGSEAESGDSRAKFAASAYVHPYNQPKSS
jgi:hypothetical protein